MLLKVAFAIRVEEEEEVLLSQVRVSPAMVH